MTLAKEQKGKATGFPLLCVVNRAEERMIFQKTNQM
jgi:hypothetical protein